MIGLEMALELGSLSSEDEALSVSNLHPKVYDNLLLNQDFRYIRDGNDTWPM